METGLCRQPSRNAPCPCGSGEKYKKCCMKNVTPEKEEHYWLLQKEAGIKDRIVMSHNQDIQSKIDCCLQEFERQTGAKSGPEGPEGEDNAAFFDWLFFDARLENGAKFMNWVSSSFPSMFTPLELAIISQWAENTLNGIYEQVEIDKENWKIKAREIISGKEYSITERSGTELLKNGDIVFARIIQVFGRHYYSGLLEPILPHQIVQFRKLVEEKFQAENDCKGINYGEFLSLNRLFVSSLTKKRPVFVNRENEKLKLCEAEYSMNGSMAAIMDWFAQNPEKFTILEVPPGRGTKAEIAILTEKTAGSRQKGGMIIQSDVVYEDGSSFHTMGSITIGKDKLTIFSTSEERYSEIRQELQQKFGTWLILKKEKIIDANDEKVLGKLGGHGGKSKGTDEPGKKSPIIKNYLAAYYKDWCSQKIPALGGITPKQALETPGGREKLKKLLAGFNRLLLGREEYTRVDPEKIIREELNFYER